MCINCYRMKKKADTGQCVCACAVHVGMVNKNNKSLRSLGKKVAENQRMLQRVLQLVEARRDTDESDINTDVSESAEGEETESDESAEGEDDDAVESHSAVDSVGEEL